jgi:hypothetical protein
LPLVYADPAALSFEWDALAVHDTASQAELREQS